MMWSECEWGLGEGSKLQLVTLERVQSFS